jgi:hypothetical protein
VAIGLSEARRITQSLARKRIQSCGLQSDAASVEILDPRPTFPTTSRLYERPWERFFTPLRYRSPPQLRSAPDSFGLPGSPDCRGNRCRAPTAGAHREGTDRTSRTAALMERAGTRGRDQLIAALKSRIHSSFVLSLHSTLRPNGRSVFANRDFRRKWRITCSKVIFSATTCLQMRPLWRLFGDPSELSPEIRTRWRRERDSNPAAGERLFLSVHSDRNTPCRRICCATWKLPKSTAQAGDGENPSDSPAQLSLSPSPVHSASAKSP